MKRHLFYLALVFWSAFASAGVVKSCDGVFSARISKPGILIVERGNNRVLIEKINHNIVGGVFDLNNSILIVYGLPNTTDVAHPQAMRLSVYSIKYRPRKIMSRTYGSGIYEVFFCANHDSALVNSRFGFDVLNIKMRIVKSFNLLSEPSFAKQVCVQK